jgi:hypothetical protein
MISILSLAETRFDLYNLIGQFEAIGPGTGMV